MVRTTVIINTHNYGRFLKACLQSVFNQTLKPDEVIVVDVASEDHTEEVCKEFDITYIKVEDKVTQTDGVAIGLYKAAYQEGLVFLLDSDDTWGTGYIEQMVQVHEESKVNYLFSDVTYTGDWSAKQGMFGTTSLAKLDNIYDWVGSPTSGLVLTWELAKSILGILTTEESAKWPYVDQVLNMASNAINVTKMFVRTDKVYYRIHGDNWWWKDWTKEKWDAYEKVNHDIVDYYKGINNDN